MSNSHYSDKNYVVVLTNHNENGITNLGLKEAKRIVDNLPRAVAYFDLYEQARDAKVRIEEAGGSAYIYKGAVDQKMMLAFNVGGNDRKAYKEKLMEVASEMGWRSVLDLPGVYEAVRMHLHDTVIEELEHEGRL